MKKIIVLLSLIVLTHYVAAVPDATDRQLQRELSKIFKTQGVELVEIPYPAKYNLNGKYYRVGNQSFHAQVKYVYVGRVNTFRSSSANSFSGENPEYFDYFILFDENKIITQVRIIDYQATHGEMISSPGWLKRFVGHKSTKPLEVGRQIDGISGATISVNKITFDIRQKTHILSDIAQ
jgi:Na+-translocating ferredoxin:NAD+ oxidoreductase RnfG subunit